MHLQPPRYALRFLRWFCRQDYLEEIEGDLTEIFEKQAEQFTAKAKRKCGANKKAHSLAVFGNRVVRLKIAFKSG